MATNSAAQRVLDASARMTKILAEEKKFLGKGIQEEWVARKEAAVKEMETLLSGLDPAVLQRGERKAWEKAAKSVLELLPGIGASSRVLRARLKISEMTRRFFSGDAPARKTYGPSGTLKTGPEVSRLDKTI